MTSRLAMGFAGFGIGAESRAIAAAVIGGASMHGGEGSIVGTFLGVIVIALINNVFIMFNGSANWQSAISGIALLIALLINVIQKRIRRNND
jgi:ribose transport system permease protein